MDCSSQSKNLYMGVLGAQLPTLLLVLYVQNFMYSIPARNTGRGNL